jgi:hypothetical protein
MRSHITTFRRHNATCFSNRISILAVVTGKCDSIRAVWQGFQPSLSSRSLGVKTIHTVEQVIPGNFVVLTDGRFVGGKSRVISNQKL